MEANFQVKVHDNRTPLPAGPIWWHPIYAESEEEAMRKTQEKFPFVTVITAQPYKALFHGS